MIALQFFLAVASLLLVIPVAIYAIEIIAGCWPGRRRPEAAPVGERPRVAVLIPAHNGALGIAGTIRSIGPQLCEGDRLIVVADNCTDETAAVARQLKATAYERADDLRRGKGFALSLRTRSARRRSA